MDIFTVALLGLVALMSLYAKMLWLTVIAVIILAAYAYGVRQEKHPVPAGGGPKIRPIIVKRRYAGPESIYPRVMKIRVKPNWDTRDWWELGVGGPGHVLRFIMRSLGLFGGKK